ncbi:hypothetical protein Q7P37_006871 [Cladosporium fusiforme]
MTTVLPDSVQAGETVWPVPRRWCGMLASGVSEVGGRVTPFELLPRVVGREVENAEDCRAKEAGAVDVGMVVRSERGDEMLCKDRGDGVSSVVMNGVGGGARPPLKHTAIQRLFACAASASEAQLFPCPTHNNAPCQLVAGYVDSPGNGLSVQPSTAAHLHVHTRYRISLPSSHLTRECRLRLSPAAQARMARPVGLAKYRDRFHVARNLEASFARISIKRGIRAQSAYLATRLSL